MDNREVNKYKYYEMYLERKEALKTLSRTIKMFDAYEISKIFKSERLIEFYDTPDNMIEGNDILVSTDFGRGGNYLCIERNIEDDPNVKFIKKFEIYKCETPILQGATPLHYIPFLSASLPRLFTQPLTSIDPDNIFKKLVKKLSINIEEDVIKFTAFGGFRGELIIESTTYKNLETGRKNFVTYLIAKETDDSLDTNGFEKFIERLEKYCKFILEIQESKHKQGKRITKKLPKPDKKKKKEEKK